MTCPLCDSKELVRVSETAQFFHCGICDLRFRSSEFHLPAEKELSRYLEHNNHTEDEAYRRFLSPAFEQIRSRAALGASGLDYGAGPGPALACMFREAGFRIELFDPNFHPDVSVLSRQYDFITCTETAEHFRSPFLEFQKLNELLRPGGWLAVMTSRLEDWSLFPQWHYPRDPTHVAFYSEKCLRWLADKFGWAVEFPTSSLTLFQK